MEFWETTPYLKWYKSHRRFSFLAKLCIEEYEENGRIPSSTFTPFLKSLHCHSRSEEKLFSHIGDLQKTFAEHAAIDKDKRYTDKEKYDLCKSLLPHMKEEETLIQRHLTVTSGDIRADRTPAGTSR